MKTFWNRDELTRELRASRPKPPDVLVNRLEQQIESECHRSRGRAQGFRLGLAAATTALVVVSFAAAGGMAAASSSVRHALSDVAQAVHITSPSAHARLDRPATPATDQYGRKKSCVKSASDRRNASIRAADRKLHRDLALAGKYYKQRVSNARKLAANKQHAALERAYGKYRAARAAAYKAHAKAVRNANGRYRADVERCPIS